MDKAREIAIRHCPGESELPLSAHSRAVWIDALTDAIRSAMVANRDAEIASLRSERDKLLEALDGLLSECDTWGSLSAGMNIARDRARAAIAAATGET